MSSIDLNIIDRGMRGTEWTAEDVALTAERLDDVLEQKTDNSGALNSLPTPFARFFVAKEAFRRTLEEHSNSKKEAGFAYKQLVSDILDVYELLFNLKFHNNTWGNGQKLELRQWSYKENIQYLKDKMPVLYHSLDEYYKTDIAEDKLYFLIYTCGGKEYLLACSSPYTGFVTPPDMDKFYDKQNSIKHIGNSYDSIVIQRKSKGNYFKDIQMFDERESDFKNYMYNILFGSDNVDLKYKFIKEYILSFKDDLEIIVDYNLKLAHVQTDQNDNLIINGLSIMYSDDIDVNSFFTPTIIRLPYRVSSKKFTTVVYQNDSKDRDYDYLLPFKPDILSLFKDGKIDSDIHLNRSSITVQIRYNGKSYKKEYAIDPFRVGMGKIVDLKAAKINFDLGLFPNILSCREQENNYFKIYVIANDENTESPNFNIDQLELSFYKYHKGDCSLIRELDSSANGVQFGVLPAVVRSRSNSKDIGAGSKLYELFNTDFQAMEIDIQGNTGLLLPIWEKSKPTNDIYTYAIDLGTSNTFMSRRKNGQNCMPELFKMNKSMVSYLHEVMDDNQISLARRIEDSIFERGKNILKTEFVPSIIDGFDYKFPVRTALCSIRSCREKPKLFDNHNIAFFYEQLMPSNNQSIKTDIKWEKNDELLRVFIRELLLIIKCDILQRGGSLDRTNLIWFRPLSFMGNIRETYKRIWTIEPANILAVQSDQIKCFSESEAPYYYFKKKDYIKDSDAAAIIDIGGGSTDFVYFKDNIPQMANSVHFGCDVLWENGLMEFDNERQNGIFLKYVDNLHFEQPELEDLNACFKHVDTAKTKDIISFWLSNSRFCDINKRLSEDFKPVFVYHLTSILFYMASMYKEYGLIAPRTVVFSGNGSKYIDSFISSEKDVLKKVVELIFEEVFKESHEVILVLPKERKESTCYGGLYRDPEAMEVPEKVYQGDLSKNYETVADINKNFDFLTSVLVDKYKGLSLIYKEVLNLLKKEHVIDNSTNTSIYVNAAEKDMETPLKTYYKSHLKEKYSDEVVLYDSVFFLPIINRIFELTKI